MDLKLNLNKDNKTKKSNFKTFSKNSDTTQTLKTFLYKIIKDTQMHARWLNTLAFLEHIGSRKILKSQNSQTMPLMVLEHVAEEARHAYFFKTLAHKLVENHLCTYFEEKSMIEGKKGEDYFQFLDHFVKENLKNLYSKNLNLALFLNYLYTTWLIEKRALWLYQIYSTILKEKSFSFHLKPVLFDEEKHLHTVQLLLEEKDPDVSRRSSELSSMEDKRFNIFLKAIHSFAFKKKS